MVRDPEIETVDAIYEALDRQDPASAWELTRRALNEVGEDPVLHYLGGQALLELDRTTEAVAEFSRACSLDADDPEYRIYHGWALFRACRFGEALREVERPGTSLSPLPERHYVRGLCLERAGETEAAETEFARAARIDPESFPLPLRLVEADFERQLDLARAALDDTFRKHLDTVTVIVEELPSDALLLEEDPPLDPEHLLGLFVGVSLDRQSSFSAGGELPPRIHLFKRNLERFSASEGDLLEQIRVTLYHELGHYLGMTEEELEDSGYA